MNQIEQIAEDNLLPKIIEIPLDNIVEIFVRNNNIEIKYEDGTKHTIKDEVRIIKGLSNNNGSPIIDHCI